jgi:hypothetical protein
MSWSDGCAERRRAALGVALALAAVGCNPPPFDFAAHQHRPRVSVLHSPLHPQPTDTITISAVAEAASGTTISQIHLTYLRAGQPAVDHDCTGQSTCDLTVLAPAGAGPANATYGAWVEDSAGHRLGAPSYAFDIGQQPGQLVLELRVPLSDKAMLRTLFVRDSATYPTDAAVWTDAEHFLEQQILVDPAWRWRDYQLGFYYDLRPGQTSDYTSRQSTRCGQDPWPGMPMPPEALFADAIGVIHNDSTFRDCGGVGIVTRGASPRRNFSAYGGNPRVVQHEMGHALFRLGDEYYESETTRRIPPVPFDPSHPCQCCDPGGRVGSVDADGNITYSGGPAPPRPVVAPPSPGGVVAPAHGNLTGVATGNALGSGGVGVVTGLGGAGGAGGAGGTVGTGGMGGITVTVCPPGAPPCAGWVPLPDCATRAGQCPPLPGDCWKQNDFSSQADCQNAAARIALNPGVEASVAAANCRQLCGTVAQPCPCEAMGAEVWIVDREHPPLMSNTGNDIMATTPTSVLYNGAACENCLEATFCMMWEMGPGRNRTLAQAEAWCLRY